MLGAKVQFPTTSKESVEKVKKNEEGLWCNLYFFGKKIIINLTGKTQKEIATIVKRTKLVFI